MTWCRLEDDMDENRKLRRLPHEAFRLYWIAVTYTRRQQTSGRLHLDDIADLAARHRIKNVRAAIAELIYVPAEYGYEHGCWQEVTPGVYDIHDHEEYNPPTSKERMRRKRERDRASQGDDSGPDGDGGVTPRAVTSSVTGDVNGASLARHGDTPRAQERAGYPNPVPKPVSRTPPASESPPQPPSRGEGESGDLRAEYRRFLEVLSEATGVLWREQSLSRTHYLERRREEFSAMDLEDAARGVALDPWFMGRNGDGVPRCDPATVLKSPKLQTFIALARGQITAGRAGPAQFDAFADALEAHDEPPLRLVDGGSA